MTIVNSVAKILPGMGSGQTYQNLNTSIASTTTGIALGTFSPPISAGKIRVQSNVIGVNATYKVGLITGTDGTTTVQLYAGDQAATANSNSLSETIEFITDLALTSINVPVTTANNTSTVDCEVSGTP